MVHIPAGETHWHGAGRETVMAHTAISLGSEFFLFPFLSFLMVSFLRVQGQAMGKGWGL